MSLVSRVTTALQSAATDIGTVWGLVNGKAADLAALSTTAKTSLVAAINEVLGLTRATAIRSGGSTTLGLADAGGTYRATSAATVTIPANATTAFPVGTIIAVVSDTTGTVTITGASGVTLNGTSGGSVDIGARYGGASLQKWATDTWIASGDVS